MRLARVLAVVVAALVPLAVCSSSATGHHPHLRSLIVNDGDDGDPISDEFPQDPMPMDDSPPDQLVQFNSVTGVEPEEPPVDLPVFFFHGVTSNANSAFNYKQNLTADGRAFVALTFCQDLCSVSALDGQVQLAIQQIRGTVAQDERFAKGYVFIGHSQGAAIARAVIEEMDDHNVRTFISLAGPQNGIFYGPQPTDAIPTKAFAVRLGPKMIPTSLFDFSKFTPADYVTGKFQADFNTMVSANPILQDKLSVVNLGRSPIEAQWRRNFKFLPVINNVNACDEDAQCEAEKLRRRGNFLKLTSAHFFGSRGDDVIAPWQSSILGQYSDVMREEDLQPNFPLMRVMDMKHTDEFTQDTYGLRTLDARGGLFLYDPDNVGHSCWVADSLPMGKTETCRFQPIYDNYIYPILTKRGWGVL